MYFRPEPHKDAPPLQQNGRCGVMLVNLGSPRAPRAAEVRRYLAEFLSDRRTIEMSPLLWQPILRGLVLPLRGSASAARYRSVWQDGGSPLLRHSRRQARLLDGALRQRGLQVVTCAAMRYGKPGVERALNALKKGGCTRILAVPMYPQYSATTIGSASDAVHAWALRTRAVPALRVAGSFALFTPWLQAAANHVRRFWQREGEPAHLVLSFHGVPQRMVELGDPYLKECFASAEQLAAALGLREQHWTLAFQSRFGRGKWLEPSTQDVLQELGRAGAQRVDVFCPGFVADCLETLEEIGIEGKALFQKAGGGELRVLPCLNDAPEWIEALADWVERNLRGWAERAESLDIVL